MPQTLLRLGLFIFISMSHKKFTTIAEVNKRMPFGTKLTALEFVYKIRHDKRMRFVRCKCECGNVSEMSVDSATTHKSCGCIRIGIFKKMTTKYYPVVPKLLHCYNAMIDRCYNLNNKRYSLYGGNGVVVCEAWRKSYKCFLDWALANGYKEGLCLDKDIKGDSKLYSPDTCCWVTNLENQSYKSNTVRYEYYGEFLTLRQIGLKENIEPILLRRRLYQPNTTLMQAIYLIKNKINRRYEKK